MAYHGIGPDSIALAEAICARMCHDFAGPLGTLSALMELVGSGGAPAQEAIPLCTDSVGAMCRRLHLLRIAWAGEGSAMGLDVLQDLAACLPSQVTANVVAEQGGGVSGAMARVALNLLLLGTDGLPRGGAIVLVIRGQTIHGLLQGVRAGWPEPATSLQAALTDSLAQTAGVRLMLAAGPACPAMT